MYSPVLVPAFGAIGSLATIMLVCTVAGVILYTAEKIAAKHRNQAH